MRPPFSLLSVSPFGVTLGLVSASGPRRIAALFLPLLCVAILPARARILVSDFDLHQIVRVETSGPSGGTASVLVAPGSGDLATSGVAFSGPNYFTLWDAAPIPEPASGSALIGFCCLAARFFLRPRRLRA